MPVPNPLQPRQRAEPQTVLAVKKVDLALVQFADERGLEVTSLAIIGDNNVHLLDGRSLGLTQSRNPVGVATEWLRKAIFEKLGRK